MSASASDSSRLALLLESCRLRMTLVELEMVMEEQQRLLETRLLTPDSISTLSFEQLTAVGLSPGVSAALSRAFPSAGAGQTGAAAMAPAGTASDDFVVENCMAFGKWLAETWQHWGKSKPDGTMDEWGRKQK